MPFKLLFTALVFFAQQNGDLIEKVGKSTINWTKGEITLSLSTEIRIKDNETMASAIFRTENKLNELLTTSIEKDILKIRFDPVSTIKNIVEANPELKHKLGFAIRNAKFSDYIIVKNRMFKSISVKIFGPNGILKALIGKVNENLTGWEKYQEHALKNTYSPDIVVIDATFSKFSPSLTTRIYDENYSLICGPETSVNMIKKGMSYIHYSSSLLKTLKNLRDGTKVLYILPKKSDGPKRGNLILFNEDVKRMLKLDSNGKITLPYIYVVLSERKK